MHRARKQVCCSSGTAMAWEFHQQKSPLQRNRGQRLKLDSSCYDISYDYGILLNTGSFGSQEVECLVWALLDLAEPILQSSLVSSFLTLVRPAHELPSKEQSSLTMIDS